VRCSSCCSRRFRSWSRCSIEGLLAPAQLLLQLFPGGDHLFLGRERNALARLLEGAGRVFRRASSPSPQPPIQDVQGRSRDDTAAENGRYDFEHGSIPSHRSLAAPVKN